MQFCVWWNEERAIQIYLRQTEVKVLTSACSLNHLQWLQHVTAPLNCPAWQNRTPNVRQNWVKQSSLPQWTKHTSRPGTRNLTVVSFRNSHGPGASAAPLTYNHSCHRISNAIPFRVFLTFLSVKQNLDFFPPSIHRNLFCRGSIRAVFAEHNCINHWRIHCVCHFGICHLYLETECRRLACFSILINT